MEKTALNKLAERFKALPADKIAVDQTIASLRRDHTDPDVLDLCKQVEKVNRDGGDVRAFVETFAVEPKEEEAATSHGRRQAAQEVAQRQRDEAEAAHRGRRGR